MAPTRKQHNRPYDTETAAAPCAGVDEAGRGCIAGPVVAAAVILPASYNLPGLTDSKLLTPAERDALKAGIMACGAIWSVGIVWQRKIDEINILQASLEAMARAILHLRVFPALALIDGRQIIPDVRWRSLAGFSGISPRQKAIVHGDALVPCISAASIIAKTYRDKLMVSLARKWPGYGFEQHKGYGTKAHFEKLAKLGPCPLHRLTFKGVRPQGCKLIQKSLLPENV